VSSNQPSLAPEAGIEKLLELSGREILEMLASDMPWREAFKAAVTALPTSSGVFFSTLNNGPTLSPIPAAVCD
jgi:hypothetical protein